MGWSGACSFPIVKPVLDDVNARKAIKAMIANQKNLVIFIQEGN